MDIHNSWIDNIDPLLRVSSQQPPWPRQPQLQQQQQQQRPLQRFIDAPERAFFTAPSYPNYGQNIQRTLGAAIPISTLPRAASQLRMVSPSPSQDRLSSTCSSARSPAPEPDLPYYSPQQLHDDFHLASGSGNSPALQDLWPTQQPGYPANYHVNMSQIQPFPDPQEIMYESDEGLYMDSQDVQEVLKSSEYPAEIHGLEISSSASQRSYRYPNDEGIGPSIASSPTPYEEFADADADADVDADVDADAEGEIEVTEEEDTEYTPRSTRTRKRRASTPPRQHNKRIRQSKALPKPKGTINPALQCKVCSRSDFKDRSALARHVASAHTRPFVCVFDFAGCESTFASKNEWKRHVASQHLNLHSWTCRLDGCVRASNGRGTEFNRKDLFTQHLRRMHAPNSKHALSNSKYNSNNTNTTAAGGGAANKKFPEWEIQLKELQISCINVKRLPPPKLICPLKSCSKVFEGANAWDERMEHVGKHLDKAVTTPSSTPSLTSNSSTVDGKMRYRHTKEEIIVQGNDRFLVSWALREGIIVRKGQNAGGYRLVLEGEQRERKQANGGGDDEDAVGEDEI